MVRSYDEVMSDVAKYLPPELFRELGDLIVEEIEAASDNGSDEMLNFTLDSN